MASQLVTPEGVVILSARQRKSLAGPQLSNGFTYDDRLYRDYREFSTVYQYPDIDLRGVREMLGMDGNPRKLEQVLTLPIRGADWEIRGDGPAMELVKTNVEPLIDRLIDQCTSAVSYRKAFFEVTWRMEGAQVVYDQIALRPAVSCEAAFNADSGRPDGFRQQLAPVNQIMDRTLATMGWIRIPANRSFIFTYGEYREPLRGISDLDVSLYCWENIRKLQFLWCQYLEGQSLPKVVVYGDDPGQAQENADNVADAEASATIPMERPGEPNQKAFDVLESSGKGADQFVQAIAYFEGKQTQSVLASFMDLAQSASAGGRGSNALSADQSEFFLAARQAAADELAAQITEGIIRPLVEYNFGPGVAVPSLHIGPLGNRQTDRALSLLTSVIAAPNPDAVPTKFIGSLLTHTATFLGLDGDEVSAAVDDWQIQVEKDKEAAKEAELLKAQQPPMMHPGFGGAPPGGPPPAPGAPGAPSAGPRPVGPKLVASPRAGLMAPPGTPKKEARLAAELGMATELLQRVFDGATPDEALQAMTQGEAVLELGLRTWVESLHPRGEHGRWVNSDHSLDKRISTLQKALKAATPTDKDPSLYDAKTGRWSPQRAAKHDEIVNELYGKANKVPNGGKAIIAGGLGGAGKSTVLGKHLGIDQGSYLTVNPDDVKEVMAAKGMIPHLPGLTPMEASALVHEESSHIANTIAAKAYAERKNMIWDITMSSPDSVSKRLDNLKDSGYHHVAGVFVDIPVEDSVTRAMGRYQRGLASYDKGEGHGGRFVPPDVIRANAVEGHSSKNRQTFDSLETRFNASTVWDNSATPTRVSQRGTIS